MIRKPIASRTLTVTLGVGLLALLVGCTKLGPDYVRPDAPIDEAWFEQNVSLTPEPVEHREWWKVFKDPILDELIASAHRQNLPLQIAGLRVIEARAALGIAVGGLYPQTQTAGAGVSYARDSENVANTAGSDARLWNYNAGFDAVWELDIWGRFRRGVEFADASVLASLANYDDVLVSLTAEVANAYAIIRTFEERITLADSNAELQRRGLTLAEARFRNGVTTELDVQQARSLLHNTEASIPRLRTGLRQAENALGTALGLSPGRVQATLIRGTGIPSAPAEVAIGVPIELLRRRPDVRRAERQAAAQSARIGVAMAELYPTVSLAGSLGFSASSTTNTTRSGNSGINELFALDSLNFVAGPGITWNILNYGRLKNNVRVEDARLQQLLVNYRHIVLRATQEVEDAMTAFLNAQRESQLLTDSVEAAQRAVDISLIQYQDGAADYTRVLDSQSTLLVQQDHSTETRGGVARELIAMYKALGGGWQIREAAPIVTHATAKQMQLRTDWGSSLEPQALHASTSAGAGRRLARPNW